MLTAIIPFIIVHWRAAMIFAVSCAFCAACLLIKVEHAHAVAAEQAAAAAQLQADTVRADAAANEAALSHNLADQRARAAATATIRSRVHAQSSTSVCAGSPPIRGLLDGMRAQGGADHASTGANGTVAVHR